MPYRWFVSYWSPLTYLAIFCLIHGSFFPVHLSVGRVTANFDHSALSFVIRDGDLR